MPGVVAALQRRGLREKGHGAVLVGGLLLVLSSAVPVPIRAQALADFEATLLWFDDFEIADYSRWTSSDYGDGWNGGVCHGNGFSADRWVSSGHSHRSEITCASGDSHRGYGGLQFAGDQVLPAFTNQGVGTEAPHGIVNTYWSWLSVPYSFGNGRWFSFWTINSDCGWGEPVITLGLENASNRLTPAHILSTGGTVTFAPNAPTLPLETWVRTTIYVNLHEGQIHIWQDGQKLLSATVSRPTTDICHWHWGAYASGDNDDVVLYEDDNMIWKLEEPWTDFDVEPLFPFPGSIFEDGFESGDAAAWAGGAEE
jgi:hypothetical protein